jgi:lipoprotein NlpD
MCGSLQGVAGRAAWRSARWLALALWGAGCVTPPEVRPVRPTIEYATAHAEPEIVSPAPPPPPPPAPPRNHTVQPGQTLYRIALHHKVEVDALMRHNGITDPTTLSVGQVLLIPGPPPAAAAEAPSAPAPPAAAATSAPAPARERPRGPVPMPTGEGLLQWPLRGVLYGRFGQKGSERHDGIDLAAPMGTPVHTAGAGKVLYAGEQKGYGNIVIVDHGGGLITLYAHNQDLRVKTGQLVRVGQVVATVGQSGRTSGPYLHFEVRKDGLPVDPLKFLGAPPERTARGRRSPDGR